MQLLGGGISLLGFRDAKSLDYITTNRQSKAGFSVDIEKRQDKELFTTHSVEELVNDPRYFFIVDGLKYVSLNVIKEIKTKRGNQQDKQDLLYISRISGEKLSFINSIKVVSFYTLFWKWKRKIRLKIRYYYYKIFK